MVKYSGGLEMAWFAAIAPYLSAAGTVMQSAAQTQSARDNEAITRYNVKMADRAAIASEASSQQEAKEAQRQANIQKSRILAIAAASGGSALDPDIVNMIAGVEGEGNLAARTALYEGSESANSLRMQSKGIAYEGAAKVRALRNESTATILSGASSIANKYWN
jgi:hypothetical protein